MFLSVVCFFQGMLRAAELIWSDGLLKKGPGLCHGVAGNAYAMLAVWRHTGDEKWWVAEWSITD